LTTGNQPITIVTFSADISGRITSMENLSVKSPNNAFADQLVDKLHELAEEDRLEDAVIFYSEFKEYLLDRGATFVEIE